MKLDAASGVRLTRTPSYPQLPGHNMAASATESAAGSQGFAGVSPKISQAAQDAYAVEARLAEIKSKGALQRSPEEHDYLLANDKRLAEITAQGKPPEKLTADELDYMQKATGMVNSFANLSTEERALYDEAVASGNKAAAAAISRIALNRMFDTAGGADGTTYNPKTMEITPATIMQYFRHSFVDPTGKTEADFQALIEFLQERPAA